jgi:hypothetical protein
LIIAVIAISVLAIILGGVFFWWKKRQGDGLFWRGLGRSKNAVDTTALSSLATTEAGSVSRQEAEGVDCYNSHHFCDN